MRPKEGAIIYNFFIFKNNRFLYLSNIKNSEFLQSKNDKKIN